MKITKNMVGKKVRLVHWDEGTYVCITAVGITSFLGQWNMDTYELSYSMEAIWEEVKPKKLYAPALYRTPEGRPSLTGALFTEVTEAKEYCGLSFLEWPALPNVGDYYEISK